MTDTIAKRDATLDAPHIHKRARVLAGAVLRLHTTPGDRATPAELAIAEGVIAEVPEPDEGELAQEHYSAQAAAVVAARRRDAELWRELFRDEGGGLYEWSLAERDISAPDWTRGRRVIRLSREATVKVLADHLDGNEGEARMMLDIAAGRALRCRDWIIAGV